MSLTFGGWELVQVLAKFIVYAGMAAATGGLLVLWLLQRAVTCLPQAACNAATSQWYVQQSRLLLRQGVLAAAAGLLASLLLFLLQVGSISQSGLNGMFDTVLLRVLATTPVGIGTACKLAGFVVVLLVMLRAATTVVAGKVRVLSAALLAALALSLLLFAASFAVVGHAAPQGLAVQLAVAVHVVAILLWTGALQPLRLLHANGDIAVVAIVLRSFGVLGWALIGCMMLGGGVMLWQLLGSASDLLSTVWGGLMLAKLQLVSCLLGLGALNKFLLVPTLTEKPRALLQTSIGLELVLALLIFTLTATLTTLTGPPVNG